MEKELLAELASQLSHPSGKKGSDIAHMMHATNIGMTQNAILNLNLAVGDKILELGHGNAGHLEYLFSQQRDIHYTGLEISTLMNQEATELNWAFIDSGNASFFLYEGSQLPFANDEFHKSFTVNTLYFWKNPVEFLMELSRVLKPQALLSLTFAHRSFMETLPFTAFGFTLYTPEDVVRLIAPTPFLITQEDAQVETVVTKTGEPVERRYATFVLQNGK